MNDVPREEVDASGRPRSITDERGLVTGIPALNRRRWTTRDIVVGSVLAVVSGFLFWGWGLLWSAVILPLIPFPFHYLLAGIWMLAGVLVPYVIRRPGAALLGELVAAFISMLPGNQWGVSTVLSGLVQGAGAELVFGAGKWRRYATPMLMAAGAVSGLCAIIFESYWYGYWHMYSTESILVAAAFMVVSGMVLGGLLSKVLADSLTRAGVFTGLAIARARRPLSGERP